MWCEYEIKWEKAKKQNLYKILSDVFTLCQTTD